MKEEESMIVYAKSRWNKTNFRCSPFDASSVSPYHRTLKQTLN